MTQATELSDRDVEIAMDIAGTILHYRQDCGCFPNTKDMISEISRLAKEHKPDRLINVALLSQDLIREANEWYDAQSIPE